MSSNEELQSSNEELQTAKEELQSANEELVTLNEELQNRNQQLDQLSTELSTLISGVNIPIVHLDHERHVRRFSQNADRRGYITDGQFDGVNVDALLGADCHTLLESIEAGLGDLESVRARNDTTELKVAANVGACPGMPAEHGGA